MNRIGARSDSGEGGEDPRRARPRPNGDNASSAIKQIASGRFGVTAQYLNDCREIEIKVAQGAKPGEGGQLPGFKVTELIAKLRHATPGVTLISPPPHHDIYSIEDLAQLIYDLKQINPDASVCVKLVSRSGIGTVAAGVAKAKADAILISGHSGGTGASPQTSVKYAGLPWEMGLSEAHQVLMLNRLRHRVRLRTDGGLKTGRDVIIAAMLGAEEFGIGTASLVAMGCIMVRQCHSNTCPVGVCTQDETLRKKFEGSPEKVINLFSFIAEEMRDILASLGVRRLADVIGRTDMLHQVSRGSELLDDLDLNPLLAQADPGPHARYCTLEGRNEVPETLDAQMIADAQPLFAHGEKMQLQYGIRNTHRAIGTKLSSQIVRRFGMAGLQPGHVTVRLRGSAGQSLGAFAVQGLKLEVLGDANDYVGKGLSGATIVVRTAPSSALLSQHNTIIGNTCLYGATAGELFAAGQAGERFAVRNSGATAVVEGCGSNGCEYMTGGTAVILGPVGDNFGAGFTGGMAFVYDPEDRFELRVNPDTVQWARLGNPHWEGVLRALVERHAQETSSRFAAQLLHDWAGRSDGSGRWCRRSTCGTCRWCWGRRSRRSRPDRGAARGKALPSPGPPSAKGRTAPGPHEVLRTPREAISPTRRAKHLMGSGASRPQRRSRRQSLLVGGPEGKALRSGLPLRLRPHPPPVISASTSLATRVALLAAGTPAYTPTCSSSSATSSGDAPVLMVARRCSRNSSSCPSPASSVRVTIERRRRSKCGRDHTPPQAVAVIQSWKSRSNAVARARDRSTCAGPSTARRVASPASKPGPPRVAGAGERSRSSASVISSACSTLGMCAASGSTTSSEPGSASCRARALAGGVAWSSAPTSTRAGGRCATPYARVAADRSAAAMASAAAA